MTQATSAKVAYTPDRRRAHANRSSHNPPASEAITQPALPCRGLEVRTSTAFIGREMTVPRRVAVGTGSAAARARGHAQSREVVPEGFSTV